MIPELSQTRSGSGAELDGFRDEVDHLVLHQTSIERNWRRDNHAMIVHDPGGHTSLTDDLIARSNIRSGLNSVVATSPSPD